MTGNINCYHVKNLDHIGNPYTWFIKNEQDDIIFMPEQDLNALKEGSLKSDVFCLLILVELSFKSSIGICTKIVAWNLQ